jgi:hypothetical protein
MDILRELAVLEGVYDPLDRSGLIHADNTLSVALIISNRDCAKNLKRLTAICTNNAA